MFHYHNQNTNVSLAAQLAARIHPWWIFVQSFTAAQQIFVETERKKERERGRDISIHIRT